MTVNELAKGLIEIKVERPIKPYYTARTFITLEAWGEMLRTEYPVQEKA